eukprot:TRINITY_DN6756_c0_g1_i1.p1 TRINITY_DN6756_c0_g1~~TRINITY_DN6756_c0_g1_i1.p1  ORF type:complete len:556 (+),score=199.69 TRINITY_DN6756_c0_g1_i1:147-1814(+)
MINMRRARLRITPNLQNLSRSKPDKSPLSTESSLPQHPTQERPPPEEEENKKDQPPENESLRLPADKENTEQEVIIEEAQAKKSLKSRPMPNLIAQRKRTLSSSSAGSSSRHRTLSEASSSSLIAQEVPPSVIEVFDQRKADHKKRFVKGVPERSSMTVFDFIFHNPSEGQKMTVEEDVMGGNGGPPKGPSSSSPSIRNSLSDKEEEEDLDGPQQEETGAEERMGGNAYTVVDDDDGGGREDVEGSMPVPQVKIGPDGQIVLDEDSTFIETTATKRAKEDLRKTSLVYETAGVTYGTWAKRRRNVEWSKKETLRFYKALSIFGTDFSMMASIFKKRDRHDLKMKFKKEERINRTLVDRCLGQNEQFDLTAIGSESEDEGRSRKGSRGPSGQRKKNKKTDCEGECKKKKKRRTSKSLRRSRGYYSSSEDEEDNPESVPADFLPSIIGGSEEEQQASKENSEPSVRTELVPVDSGGGDFPPGLLAANPGLANATSGSLVLVAASPTPANANLHVYMVSNDKNDASSGTGTPGGRVRTLSSSSVTQAPETSSSSNKTP